MSIEGHGNAATDESMQLVVSPPLDTISHTSLASQARGDKPTTRVKVRVNAAGLS